MAATMPSTNELAAHSRPQNNNNNNNNNKRKASAAGLPGAARQIKRRASKACCCCRARKVRCDVVENGSPCTNCRLDEVECVVTESRRRKLVPNCSINFLAVAFEEALPETGEKKERKDCMSRTKIRTG